MILWTIRSKQEWEALEKTGILRTDRAIAEEEGVLEWGPEYHYYYSWMAKKMKDRLPPSGLPEDALPLWGWYQRYSSSKKRPDLRTEEYRAAYEVVMIEFKIDDELVLLSDFDLWHCVLCNSYIPSSEIDADAYYFDLEFMESFYRIPPEHSLYQSKVEKSWEKIFDLEQQSPLIHPKQGKSIQATFWELRLEQVRKVKELGSCSKKMAA